jgi:hypothetical protein
MAEPKDIILGILGASVSLSGLLLVFIGFVYSHAETFESIPRRDRYRKTSKGGLIPFVETLVCAWLCLGWLTGNQELYWWALQSFRAGMILTAVYGLITLLVYL